MPKATKPTKAKASAAKKLKKKVAPSSAKKPVKAGKSSSKTLKASKASKLSKSRRSGAEASLSSPGNPVIKDDGKGTPPSKRKLGLRGAAPWAARHAAKHAAEARARAAEPAPPGSARATIRAEAIKQKIGDLHNQTQKIRNLRKRLDKGFFEIGEVLHEIQSQELYVAKGYGSFEAFLEREIDLGKQTSLKLIKIAHIFQQDAALDYGMDRLFAAISALEGESTTPKPSIPSSPGSKPMLPLKPPMRIVG